MALMRSHQPDLVGGGGGAAASLRPRAHRLRGGQEQRTPTLPETFDETGWLLGFFLRDSSGLFWGAFLLGGRMRCVGRQADLGTWLGCMLNNNKKKERGRYEKTGRQEAEIKRQHSMASTSEK